VEIDQYEHLKPDDNVKPASLQAADGLQVVKDQPADATSETDDTVLGFRVGVWGLLLDSNIYCEIVDQTKISLLPNVQAWFSGVLNLRGNIVPVIDLHILLNQDKPTDNKARRLLAVDRGKKTVAFWIDGYPHMLSTATLHTSSAPALPDILKKSARACHTQDAQLWLTLSLDTLFKSMSYQAVQTEV
jgi:twitching motility protein PilI